MQGWEFWSDVKLVYEGEDGKRVFAKDGYKCHCSPGIEPGDADSEVCKAGLGITRWYL